MSVLVAVFILSPAPHLFLSVQVINSKVEQKKKSNLKKGFRK